MDSTGVVDSKHFLATAVLLRDCIYLDMFQTLFSRAKKFEKILVNANVEFGVGKITPEIVHILTLVRVDKINDS